MQKPAVLIGYVQWGALQDTARMITLVLDRNSEGYRKCPGCRGSGLFKNSFTRLEKKGAHPNQPCWFCEGIGALPVAGLNGFVLARTTPCLKALDNHNQHYVDTVQLNGSRNGEETSKFTNAKLSTNLADLFFNFNTPPWINCTALGCQQNVLEKSKAKESIFQPSVSKPRLQSVSSFADKEPFSKNGFFQRIMNAPLILSVVNSLQSNATLSPLHSSVSSLQSRTVLAVPVNEKAANIHPVRKLRSGFTMHHVSYTQKTLYCNVSSIDNQQESEFSGPFITKVRTPSACSLFSTKRRRLQLEGRNHIRDKAQKEAQERAGGLMRTLKYKDNSDYADSHVQPECTATTSESSQGLGAHEEYFPPSDMAARIACLTSVAVCRRALLIKLIADGFEVLMPTTAKTMR